MPHFLIILLLLVGCASNSRTKYQAQKKNEGYSQREFEYGLQAVNFKANRYTSKEDVELFAKLRAIEICRENNFKLAHIMDVIDKTRSKEVRRTSSNYYGPSYYYGMAPFYSRFSNFGFGFGINNVQSNSWEETLTIPEFEVIYRCANEAHEPEVILREVSADEMKTLVKDLRGAIQVERVMDGSPNKDILVYGDILIKAKGNRIQRAYQLLRLFDDNSMKSGVEVELLREGDKKKVILRSKEVTDEVLKAQNALVQSACGKKDIKNRAICK